MDWSKAKNIIIAVLLAANLLMGINLLSRSAGARQQIALASEESIAFLEQQGMAFETDVPRKTEKLPVLFLRLQRVGDLSAPEEYKGYPIVVQGSQIGFEIAGTGQQAAETMPAAEALLKLYAQLSKSESAKGKTVESIDLVYLLSPDDTSYAAQDTASPAWRIQLSGHTYYVDAYEE